MHSSCLQLLGLLCLVLATSSAGLRAETTDRPLMADPPEVLLMGADARRTVLLQGIDAANRPVDWTSQAAWSVEDPAIATMHGSRVKPLKDGQTRIVARVGTRQISIPLTVRDSQTKREYHFVNDIEPLFGRFGCNTSGCHGKAEGQNGFKLSVFGFDPESDHAALVSEARGRRLFAASPERSLLLTKASGQVPHGGGIRIPAGTEAYELLAGWIAAGAPMGSADTPPVKSVRIEPGERVLAPDGGQQLRVIAIHADGRERDVTSSARFQTNNEAVAVVDAGGKISATGIPGEAAVMASFANESAVFRVMVPQSGKFAVKSLPSFNFIDDKVAAKLAKLNIERSGLCDDATFLRRAFLDVTGTLPTVAETKQFLADTRSDKRSLLVNDLLDRPEYADLWSLKWADVLRVDRQVLGHQRAYDYHRWIHSAFAKNTPFDVLTRELVTAEGPLDESPAANFYRVATKPGDAANSLSQVFLGIRLACAECHHHPFDRWGQDDYHGMAAFFAPVGFKKIGPLEALGANGEAVSKNPRTGKTLSARALGAALSPETRGDRRVELANWMTAPGNPFFARNIANRYWAHFMGRGLFEPVDDMRATNPPSNPELLDALAESFAGSHFDVKQLIRLICASRAYQTSSAILPGNVKDEQNHSRMLLKRPDAETLLDMISDATGIAEKYEGMLAGARAIQLWDSKTRHSFLKQFGRPARASACECERNAEPSIAQVLNLLNGETLNDKLRHDQGRVAILSREIKSDSELIEQLYLAMLARRPTEAESARIATHLAKNKDRRRQAIEDVAWALVNTKEFLFVH